VHFLLIYTVKTKGKLEVAILVFCCCSSWAAPEAKKNDQKSIGKMCKSDFTGLLARVPRIRVIQTIAGVMPERSKCPNLALKRSSKSTFR
jgi:hypothetical protein